ncbi:hypothetical protein KC909_00105, partial [Candidatus Dojkabacteria bacterium]|nr:hypothetical protein [Candidatus Dojkabacteria bacterium]
DLDNYNKQCEQLVQYFNSLSDTNIMFEFSKIRDEITIEQVNSRLDKIIEELRAKWDNQEEDEIEHKLAKAERNYNIDWSNVSQAEKKERLVESALVHDAFIMGDWEEGVTWAFAKDMVTVGFRYTGTWGIHLKSSRASSVQFWVGSGVLIEREGEYLPSILSYEKLKEAELQQEEINIPDLHDISPQLKTINICK